MKLIEINEKGNPFTPDGKYSYEPVLNHGNNAAYYIQQMLKDYQKLQEAYNESTETEPFQQYLKPEAQSINAIYDTKEKLEVWASQSDTPTTLANLAKNATEIDALNAAVSLHNQKVFNAAKNFLIRLGFKEKVYVTKRSKRTEEEAQWLTELKTMTPVKPSSTGYGYCSTINSRIAEINRTKNEEAAKKRAEQAQLEKELAEQKAIKDKEVAIAKSAKQEILLIAHTCIKYDIPIDEVNTLEELDKKLISLGHVPASVMKDMLAEITK